MGQGVVIKSPQTLVGVGTLAIGALFVAGALTIKSDSGYPGVGPNFLPWVVGLGLLLCGMLLVREARSGGFREMDEPSGAARGHWPGFVRVSVGILVNAALITTIGFILSCALCFVLAVRGFKSAEGRLNLSPKAWAIDFAIGFVIAAPVCWMFTQLLAINLPGLTSTGWL
ncbi:MAG: tripartite tricarboxylate transporter TctB family protein [Rhizobacter sp.]|nr:tripartite tricarboxylate transporter TctB family protein [Rhizobacter sp.]